jgi:hypothetical protein
MYFPDVRELTPSLIFQQGHKLIHNNTSEWTVPVYPLQDMFNDVSFTQIRFFTAD